MGEEREDRAISVEVGPDRAAAHLSGGLLQNVGGAFAWLFPKKDARAKITAALAKRVSKKIEEGTCLDAEEQYFVARVFEREAKILSNQEASAARVSEVLPEVKERVECLTDKTSNLTSSSFVARAETIAGESADEEVSNLFARAIAGEMCRPGTCSVRTIETIRSMDTRLAKAFQNLSNFVFDNAYVIDERETASVLDNRGIGRAERLDLKDLGLVEDDVHIPLSKRIHSPLEYGLKSIIVSVEKPADLPEWISVLRLTRVGREIASVLPFVPDGDYFNLTVDMIRKKVGQRGTVTVSG